ncbi:hypothetical protein ACIOWK_32575 [Pseudomonas protegens]|uniref:hypothetical protein n=1 Tax=Pseudomonas protegens TaxID=380021 RepID=UPI0038213F1B
MSNEMISVPRELLEQALQADASMRATTTQLVEGWAAMKELRERLAMPSLEDSRVDLIAYLRGEVQRFESIFTPTDLMLLRGGEKMLELCAPEGKFVGISWNDMREVLAAMIAVSPIGSGKLEQGPAAQHQSEPILIQAVAVTRQSDDGMYLEWLLEGGISEMEFPGQVLFAMPEANDLCDEDGSAEIYTRPVEQPAPVAVVLPRRRIIRAENPAARISHSQGWNACLDEVARLNPPQQ